MLVSDADVPLSRNAVQQTPHTAYGEGDILLRQRFVSRESHDMVVVDDAIKCRIPSKTSSPDSYRVPTQKAIPLLGLGTSEKSRSKSLYLHRIWGFPRYRGERQTNRRLRAYKAQ